MGLGDKVGNAAEEAAGKVKEKTGEANRRRGAQGRGPVTNRRQTSSNRVRK
jgi:uncharacterized protein YjbJ (UPF0337 family)